MRNNPENNRFSYVIGADQTTQNELIGWVSTSLEYINLYFGGDRIRIVKTKFGDCVSKVEYLADLVIDSENASLFRGVRDTNGRLQAGAIVSFTNGLIYPYTEERNYLSIDPFTTPPWNCLEGVTFPETVKGAGTWLMSEIVQEVIDTEISGVIKISAIDRAKSFYLSMGFQENPDYQREMVLTREEARLFLSRYQIYKEN
jgi:hypothetical protein